MCGFAGFLDPRCDAAMLDSTAEAMAATLVHRGPDDCGVWSDPAAGVGLGFRRLSILELSPAGHQPMTSRDGRYVVTFNGEIYNYQSLRQRLGDDGWRGGSDTEVLLEAVRRWGVVAAVAACDGMFAFALWDREARTLTLGRDRFGEKPLFYAWNGGAFLFGSELKALRAHPAWRGGVDRDALALYMRLGWLPAPTTIHAQARKLPPGCLLTLDAGSAPGAEVVTPYWSARAEAARAAATPFAGPAAAAADRLHELLSASVGLRRHADVPVGVFLSGGVDSSAIAAIMTAQTGGAAHSFTIGFSQDGFDESPYARAVAGHLGTRHTELVIDDSDALAVVPQLARIYDEPFADVAQIPTCLLARLTRQSVTVALSGDGGDELFGGYDTYRDIPAQWDAIRGIPGRGLAGALAPMVPGRALNAAADALGRLVGRQRRSAPGHRARRLLEDLAAPSAAELLYLHYARWRGQPALVVGAAERLRGEFATPPAMPDTAGQVMVLDALTYLPDDLCVKTDRATMAHSLEARLPFLDPAIAAFAWSLPTGLKIRDGIGKAVLRDVLYRLVPRPLVDRPKMGFEVPIARWLQGALRGWAEDLLSESRLRRQGLLDPAPVLRAWHDLRDGRKARANEVWFALMFQSWLETQ